MKKIIIICATILSTACLYAQSPERISYQAVLRDAGNNLVTNQSVGMQISILRGSVNGTAIYMETQIPVTNDNGLVSIEIGTGTTSDDFSGIDWANGPYFLKTETDPAGGTNYTITGTSQLLSVPYALYAKTAESLTGTINEADPVYSGSEAANITATDIANLSNLSGINTGDQDLSTLASKTVLGDSTAQIRSEIPDVSAFLTDETDPVYSSSIASKITGTDTTNWNNKLDTEVDGSVTNEIQNLSQVLAQSNDAGTRQIKNVADPVDSKDVVTKAYLESYTHDTLYNDNLILWNKLGSNEEVLASNVGENGELVGTGHNFETAKYGNGYVRTNTSSYVKFPDTVLESCRSEGTLEFWVDPKVTNPTAYQYGAFMLVGYSINCANTMAFVRWGDGTTGNGISGGINFDGTIHKTPEESSQFVATVGTPFHIALVWDVDGIDGTDETIRLYRDGVVIGTSTDIWDDDASVIYDNFYIGTGPDSEGYDKYIMDNIKVWNTTKTSLAATETEGEDLLYYAGDGIDITNNVISEDKYKIGDFAQGGIIFWVDETGRHGLVCAKYDQDFGSGIQWYNGSYVSTASHGDAPYGGEMNTVLIIAKQGDLTCDYAAGRCATMSVIEGGKQYGDWYLPSFNELIKMYENKAIINTKALSNAGTAFADEYYWSSFENSSGSSMALNFSNGNSLSSDKNSPYRVRAIRAF